MRKKIKMKKKIKMWPTPRATDYFPGVGKYVKETSTGYAVIRKKTRRKFGAKLADAVDYEERKNKDVEDTNGN